jgi:pyruvate carboxylase
MPTHYSFKGSCQVERLEADYKLLAAGHPRPVKQRSLKSLQKDATKILTELDPDGRWVTDDDGKPVIDTANADPSELLLESRVFSRNLSRLAEYVRTATAASSLPPADK